MNLASVEGLAGNLKFSKVDAAEKAEQCWHAAAGNEKSKSIAMELCVGPEK